ncbi:hypothetical protein [Massilia glaciei]|nr:hypothetical protein [Massilia glaciei]
MKRMRYLRNMEALAAIALPLLFVHDWTKPPAAALAWELRVPAMCLLSYLLLQGSWYWHLKIVAMERRQALPAYFHPLYRGFKWANTLLLAAMLVALAGAAAGGARAADLGWAGGLLAGAVLEQINYFHYQLMYDTRGAIAHLRRNARLRTPALAIDLKRAGAERAAAPA